MAAGPRQPSFGAEPLSKTALVSGASSGIGAATVFALLDAGFEVFAGARRGDRLAQLAEKGARPLLLDLTDDASIVAAVESATANTGRLDVLVNNAGEQHPQEKIEDIAEDQIERTFRTNVFAQFFMVKAALPHMKSGSSIVNIASITAYEGNPDLLDYSATKGAVVSFTRALSNAIIDRGIRVNAVAPGPIWTPLIPASYSAKKVEQFGKDTPVKRPGQPEEVAPAVIFLASNDASYISGQTLHVNGGTVVNG